MEHLRDWIVSPPECSSDPTLAELDPDRLCMEDFIRFVMGEESLNRKDTKTLLCNDRQRVRLETLFAEEHDMSLEEVQALLRG